MTSAVMATLAWPVEVTDFRATLRSFSKNVSDFSSRGATLRAWMAANDPDYPTYHLAPPEGWANDPNGVTHDPASGLYHRFYQWDKTYDEDCMHGRAVNCSAFGFEGLNRNSRVWGHTVSRDLVTWEEWPGIDSDSPSDRMAVFSGNCAIADGKPVCIYSGGSNKPCDTGTCAYSDDWIHWRKTACMTTAPSAASQVNHDTAIFRVGKEWRLLIGGCTFNGTNVPSPGVPCAGNAQVWRSSDLLNFSYVQPLTPGGPGGYWELPYLLPFDAEGKAMTNAQARDILAVARAAALLPPSSAARRRATRRARPCSSASATRTGSAASTAAPRASRPTSMGPRPAAPTQRQELPSSGARCLTGSWRAEGRRRRPAGRRRACLMTRPTTRSTLTPPTSAGRAAPRVGSCSDGCEATPRPQSAPGRCLTGSRRTRSFGWSSCRATQSRRRPHPSSLACAPLHRT